MKRGLKVKSGVRAPARLDLATTSMLSPDYNALPVVVLNSQGVEVARQDFYAPIECPNNKPGDGCWYCIQRGAK